MKPINQSDEYTRILIDPINYQMELLKDFEAINNLQITSHRKPDIIVDDPVKWGISYSFARTSDNLNKSLLSEINFEDKRDFYRNSAAKELKANISDAFLEKNKILKDQQLNFVYKDDELTEEKQILQLCQKLADHIMENFYDRGFQLSQTLHKPDLEVTTSTDNKSVIKASSPTHTK